MAIQTLTLQLAFPSEQSWDLKPRAIDGKELANWQNGPDLMAFLMELEKEGWRIVGGITKDSMKRERECPDSA